MNFPLKQSALGNQFQDQTPELHVFKQQLHQQISCFRNGFPGHVTYAVKSNDDSDVIHTMYEFGINCFDVASLHEMEIVRNIAPNADLHYHNPVRSSSEILNAFYGFGCKRFAVDHLSELEKLYSLLPETSGIEIAIRFRNTKPSQAVQAFKSKFGAEPDYAALLLSRAIAMGFTTGLTFHPGSQTMDPLAYTQHIEIAANIAQAANTKLQFLNVGGGFPAQYENLIAQPLQSFFDAIGVAAFQSFPEGIPHLECEPGRALVGPSGTLVTTIKSVRRDTGELFLNDGIYGGLMEVHQFPALQPRYTLHTEAPSCAAQTLWTVYGPTCDPTDVLPFRLLLSETVQDGDQIAFEGTGAYSTATSTRFNGYGAVRVLVR